MNNELFKKIVDLLNHEKYDELDNLVTKENIENDDLKKIIKNKVENYHYVGEEIDNYEIAALLFEGKDVEKYIDFAKGPLRINLIMLIEDEEKKLEYLKNDIANYSKSQQDSPSVLYQDKDIYKEHMLEMLKSKKCNEFIQNLDDNKKLDFINQLIESASDLSENYNYYKLIENVCDKLSDEQITDMINKYCEIEGFQFLISFMVDKISDSEIRYKLISQILPKIDSYRVIDIISDCLDDESKTKLYFNNPFAHDVIESNSYNFINSYSDQTKALFIIDNYYKKHENEITSYFNNYLKPRNDDLTFQSDLRINQRGPRDSKYPRFKKLFNSYSDKNAILFLLDRYSNVLERKTIVKSLLDNEYKRAISMQDCMDILVEQDDEILFRIFNRNIGLYYENPETITIIRDFLPSPLLDLIHADENPEYLNKYNNGGKEIGIDSNITIGIEIETIGEFSNILLNSFNFNEWKVDRDLSVHNGCEVISKILQDTQDDMKQLEAICNCLKQSNFFIDDQCGGHIHLGVAYFDDCVKGLENVVRIWNESETLLYKMSNPESVSPRPSTVHWARPSSLEIEEMYPNGEIEFNSLEDFIKLRSTLLKTEKKYRGLNLGHFGEDGKNTIEFRIPNGTIEPEEIKNNIRLYAKLFEVSKKMALDENYKSEEFEALKNRDVSEKQKALNLLDLLFDDQETKDIYYRRWEYAKDNPIFQSEEFGKFGFNPLLKEDYEEHERYIEQNQVSIREIPIILEDISDTNDNYNNWENNCYQDNNRCDNNNEDRDY